MISNDNDQSSHFNIWESDEKLESKNMLELTNLERISKKLEEDISD